MQTRFAVKQNCTHSVFCVCVSFSPFLSLAIGDHSSFFFLKTHFGCFCSSLAQLSNRSLTQLDSIKAFDVHSILFISVSSHSNTPLQCTYTNLGTLTLYKSFYFPSIQCISSRIKKTLTIRAYFKRI